MPNGRPPVCDAACQKIILNSGNIASLNQNFLDAFTHAELDDNVKDKIIACLNKAEDELRDAQTLVLRGVGYHGPVGKLNT